MRLFSLWPFNKRQTRVDSDGLQLSLPEKSLLDAALASSSGAPPLEYDQGERSNFYNSLRLPLFVWMMRQKSDVCAVLAARAALRCCDHGTIYRIATGASEPAAQDYTLILLWAAAKAFFATRYPHRTSELHLDQAILFVQSYIKKRDGYKKDYLLQEMKAAECALRATKTRENFSLAAAALEFNADVAYSRAAIDPASEYSYSPAFAQDALALMEFDIQMIERGATAFELSQQPLVKALKTLNFQYVRHLQAEDKNPESWRLWLDWYDRHAEGVANVGNFDFVYGSLPVAVIAQGLAVTNAWLADRLQAPFP